MKKKIIGKMKPTITKHYRWIFFWIFSQRILGAGPKELINLSNHPAPFLFEFR